MHTYYVFMNVTLSADDDLVKRAREYARNHNTSLNQLIRDYLSRLVAYDSGENAAELFEATARSLSGRSEPGWRFDRGETHRYGA